MDVVESLSGIVEEARESKNKTGWNYKVGSRWLFADNKLTTGKVGDSVLLEFESSKREDGREANFIRSLKIVKEPGVVVDQVSPSDVDVLVECLAELREIKALLKNIKMTV
jgi:hypothetical protein